MKEGEKSGNTRATFLKANISDATKRIPTEATRGSNMRPARVFGTMSPNPMVVNVTTGR
jgi:hypothetical protein